VQHEQLLYAVLQRLLQAFNMVCPLGEHQHIAPLSVLLADSRRDHVHARHVPRQTCEHFLDRCVVRDFDFGGEPLRQDLKQMRRARGRFRCVPDRSTKHKHHWLLAVAPEGFATVAMAAMRPPSVVGYLNFSGGAAGLPERGPDHSCAPAQMTELMKELGKTTAIPGLWLYAENDHYWGAEAPHQWFETFASGGSAAQFINAGELPGRDGHQLLHYGGKMWSVPVNSL
jgi:hypothetical protein